MLRTGLFTKKSPTSQKPDRTSNRETARARYPVIFALLSLLQTIDP